MHWSGASALAQLNPVLSARNRASIRDAKVAVSGKRLAQQRDALQDLPEVHQQGGEKEAGSLRQDRESWERQTATSGRLAGFCPQTAV